MRTFRLYYDLIYENVYKVFEESIAIFRSVRCRLLKVYNDRSDGCNTMSCYNLRRVCSLQCSK